MSVIYLKLLFHNGSNYCLQMFMFAWLSCLPEFALCRSCLDNHIVNIVCYITIILWIWHPFHVWKILQQQVFIALVLTIFLSHLQQYSHCLSGKGRVAEIPTGTRHITIDYSLYFDQVQIFITVSICLQKKLL